MIEREMLDVGEKLLLKIGRGHVITGRHKREHVFEHTTCGSRSRHKLHHAVAALLLIGLPCLHGPLLRGLVGGYDAFAHGCRRLQTEEREPLSHLFELMLHTCHGHAAALDLSFVCFCKHLVLRFKLFVCPTKITIISQMRKHSARNYLRPHRINSQYVSTRRAITTKR